MSSLTGQLLVSMPQMGDPFFAQSVVYLCAHSMEEGAMGLIVNKTIDSLTMDELYEQLEIAPVVHSRQQPVYFGGPVAVGQGFVLHSADYREEGTLGIGNEVGLTATLDILRATAKGAGPRQSLVTLGYAGWGPGQLDAELGHGDWILEPARREDAFSDEPLTLWESVLTRKGGSYALVARMPADPSMN
jgi:putative transcriptional regulator